MNERLVENQETEEKGLFEKLVITCSDTELGPVLGPYIVHFIAPELEKVGILAVEQKEVLVQIGIENIDSWLPTRKSSHINEPYPGSTTDYTLIIQGRTLGFYGRRTLL